MNTLIWYSTEERTNLHVVMVSLSSLTIISESFINSLSIWFSHPVSVSPQYFTCFSPSLSVFTHELELRMTWNVENWWEWMRENIEIVKVKNAARPCTLKKCHLWFPHFSLLEFYMLLFNLWPCPCGFLCSANLCFFFVESLYVHSCSKVMCHFSISNELLNIFECVLVCLLYLSVPIMSKLWFWRNEKYNKTIYPHFVSLLIFSLRRQACEAAAYIVIQLCWQIEKMMSSGFWSLSAIVAFSRKSFCFGPQLVA